MLRWTKFWLKFTYYWKPSAQIKKELPEMLYKRVVLESFAKFTFLLLIRLQTLGLKLCFKKETLEQVFSCEFWKTYKSISFTELLRMIASEGNQSFWTSFIKILRLLMNLRRYVSRYVIPSYFMQFLWVNIQSRRPRDIYQRCV